VAPDVPVPSLGARFGAAGTLEPGMLVGGVVDDQLGDDTQLAPLRLLHQAAVVLNGADIRIDLTIVRDVVAVVASGRWIERQQPQRGDTEILQVAEPRGEAGEIADAVAVAVGKRLDVK